MLLHHAQQEPRMRHSAWLLTAIGLVLVLERHLLPSLLAALLVHELVHLIVPTLQKRISSDRGKLLAIGLLATIVVGLTTAGVLGVLAFFRSDAGNISALLARIAQIIEDTRSMLPSWIAELLPAPDEGGGNQDLKTWVTALLRTHAVELGLVGKDVALIFVHILIGMIIGAMVAAREAIAPNQLGPLASALAERAARIALAFRRVVFAQVRISLLNTTLTSLYLAAVLPLCGIHLPLVKSLIGITFLCGLLPVVGNVMSNCVIVLVSMAHSPQVAMGSLAFLVIIHKVEYFFNARIVGGQIQSAAWELLTAMLAMEAVFGLPGLILAPIAYAWVKDELKAIKLI